MYSGLILVITFFVLSYFLPLILQNWKAFFPPPNIYVYISVAKQLESHKEMQIMEW